MTNFRAVNPISPLGGGEGEGGGGENGGGGGVGLGDGGGGLGREEIAAAKHPRNECAQ